MANRKAAATWKISIEVESLDVGASDSITTTIGIEGGWTGSPRSTKGGPLGLIAYDLGSLAKMLDDCGKLVPGGDAVLGFTEGFTGEDLPGSQE